MISFRRSWIVSALCFASCAVERNQAALDGGADASAHPSAVLDAGQPMGEGEGEESLSSFEVAPPVPPAPPRLEDGTPFDAWEPRDDCPPGQMPEFGRDGCIWIGDPCPEGDWPEDLPAEGVTYVTPGGTGDGSRPERPMGDVQSAIDGSGAGAVVALSKGLFRTAVDLDRGISLIGACARDTVLEAMNVNEEDPVTLALLGRGGHARNMTITGDAIGVLLLTEDGLSTLHGVHVRRAAQVGIYIYGESVRAKLDTVVISDTQLGPTAVDVNVVLGAELEVRRMLIENNQHLGLSVQDGSNVAASDIVIKGMMGALQHHTVAAVQIHKQGKLDLRRAYFDGNRDWGFLAGQTGTEVTAEDVVIKNTRGSRENLLSAACLVQWGGRVRLDRGLLENHRKSGLDIRHEGTVLTANDLTVRGTSGVGVQVVDEASSIMKRLVLEGGQLGLALARGARGDVEDLVVRATRANRTDRRFGQGVLLQDGARLDLVRSVLDDNQEFGLYLLNEGTEARVQDLVVKNTRARDLDGVWGRGVQVQQQASLELVRALVSQNREIGVLVAGLNTSLSAHQVVIENTRVRTCADPPEGASYPPCPLPLGDGLMVIAGARVSLTDLSCRNNHRVGVYVFAPPENTVGSLEGLLGSPALGAVGGEIADNGIGINLRASSVSPADFQQVICKDNPDAEDGCFAEKNLPLPDVEGLLGELLEEAAEN